MRIAIVHDWLVTYAGSERVLEQMLQCYPDADLFSLVDFLPPDRRGFILNKPATTSFIQRLPFSRAHFRAYLPLMPLAVEQFDLSGYDLVISSSHAVAKGVLVGPDQLHLCMCYSPLRYAWDLQHQYLREAGLDRGLKGWLTRWLLHRLRLWDSRTAHSVDRFIAISHYIARRIEKTYRREATVIYPPVTLDGCNCQAGKENFYLAVSRLVPYKRMPLILEAFARLPERQLVMIGDGPELARCRSMAGPNVRLLGWQSDTVVRDNMQRARALLFAAEEDFGITPLEAQACGTPVIAFGKGGSLETLRGLEAERPTAVFYAEQTAEAIAAAVMEFEREEGRVTASACRDNAARFGVERFRREFTALVETEWAGFCHYREQGRMWH